MGSRTRRDQATRPPGRPSILEQGWHEGDGPEDPNALSWATKSPIGQLLALVGVGLSVREACTQTRINRGTITGLLEHGRRWRPTGHDAYEVHAIGDPHTRRAVAFALELDARQAAPKSVALTSIVAAAVEGDWRAGQALLKLLYRDEFADRIEHTGAEGKPLSDVNVVAERLGQVLANMVAAAKDDEIEAAEVADVEEGEERPRAPVTFPTGAVATPGQQAG